MCGVSLHILCREVNQRQVARRTPRGVCLKILAACNPKRQRGRVLHKTCDSNSLEALALADASGYIKGALFDELSHCQDLLSHPPHAARRR